MYKLCFVAFFLSAVGSDELSYIFNPDKATLADCIAKELGNIDDQFKSSPVANKTSQLAARRFHKKPVAMNNLNYRFAKFYYELRTGVVKSGIKKDDFTKELRAALKQALILCADIIVNKHEIVAVPSFENESPGMAEILNLILVKWPEDLYHMIQSWNGRAVLRRYASNAWVALLRELQVFESSTQTFRVVLQFYWSIRVREMYDGNSVSLPYVEHLYTLNYPTPHMVQTDLEKFTSRSRIDFRERNPSVPDALRREILNIHKSDRTNSSGHDDVYDGYKKYGMASSEYYFEHQLNQFYRVIFFIMELQARGICTDGNDDFVGPLPNDLVPEHVQAIVYDDDVYRDYLLNQRLFYKKLMVNGSTKNDVDQNLFESARVIEENLILLMSDIPSTSETTSTARTESTTTQSSKRKDDVWKNANGKCFPKRARTTTIPDTCNGDENFDEVTCSNRIVIDLTDEDLVTRDANEENSNHIDLTDEDSMSTCFSDEFDASPSKEETAGTDNLYGYVIGKDGSQGIQFTHEEWLFIQEMSCFIDLN